MRPKKQRKIGCCPCCNYFKPRGTPLRKLDEVDLAIDELEALRLADLDNIEQIKAAKKMNISQSTFQRILVSAHKKIAEAILLGKAIRIEKIDD
jgi:predicted DNA-binding protein (UPF0251 family)